MQAGNHGTKAKKNDARNFLPGKVAAWFGWDELRQRMYHAISFLAPVGYEDESGFHFGVEPACALFDLRPMRLFAGRSFPRHSNFTWPGPNRDVNRILLQDFRFLANGDPPSFFWMGDEFPAN
jgi:hypothetical protein